jgi:hypothetical protein
VPVRIESEVQELLHAQRLLLTAAAAITFFRE